MVYEIRVKCSLGGDWYTISRRLTREHADAVAAKIRRVWPEAVVVEVRS